MICFLISQINLKFNVELINDEFIIKFILFSIKTWLSVCSLSLTENSKLK